ncbi:site-2 protease family protein [bacterium (Candidatus Gribaldobacteria) CG07_land_8_20_14_0_80_33_18]|uniref:Site-2 protease family protein n=1 Tax=bacterium (Candidatus Gribaldobacteria) CG07_land_8_20_14_0_80_33_18 TaxID=2014272 RepID=A0A2M6Z2T2_9BACT|nr:MAG: site-2 protease family protein [bacterium (Candidatus Gribaldobacteria) CG10_big_fil_rev_8_21_14_0_10_33_41]PIU46713.1 MAG: site-2 protease family protein [bacterium (Candidatus Gribaldobacteria) CG07_land_8_20_14_0_80_33_18]PJA00544.1 MAG: site-2 protease family protein [bacterium (Candidatus Gribaldobacteria) CG_4_10_14_0_2_um_filter_33_15]PJB08898.1 MAG: site-2 protease family protein [bacterium (Candidatus Gribaldobacteria) CG_4_9_14_3_um_filter_33_9]
MEIISFIFIILIFLFSIIIHEVSHGAMADYLGDPTAKLAGRLTLNPIKHLDPIGSIFVPLMLIISRVGIIFGWAKPVPINPFNLKDKVYGQAKVALAGPLANILVALIFGIALRFLPFLFSTQIGAKLIIIFSYIVWINLVLAIFNLMPIPPLDGSHILFTFLPKQFDKLKIFLIQYQLFILLFFIFFGFSLIIPLVKWAFHLIVGIPFS